MHSHLHPLLSNIPVNAHAQLFGPTKELNGLWRIKTNEELDELIKRIRLHFSSSSLTLFADPIIYR
jgi:hypothetical protein